MPVSFVYAIKEADSTELYSTREVDTVVDGYKLYRKNKSISSMMFHDSMMKRVKHVFYLMRICNSKYSY